jgi:hypothetical protein
VRKQEPIVDLKRRANVHAWKSKKTPYLCKIAKEKRPACIPSPWPSKAEQQQPTSANAK